MNSAILHDDDIFTVQSTVEFLSSGGEANILFRTGKSSATDMFEGPTYRYGLNTWTNEVQLFINDGENSDTLKRVSVPSGLSVNTKYTISVHGEGDVYNFYLDGDLMIGPMTLSDLKCTGSVGIWTYGSAATFCSFEYTAFSDSEWDGASYGDVGRKKRDHFNDFEPIGAMKKAAPNTWTVSVTGKDLFILVLVILNVFTLIMLISGCTECCKVEQRKVQYEEVAVLSENEMQAMIQ